MPAPTTRALLRAGAVAAIGSAVALPFVRRRLQVPTPVTVAVMGSAPLALAVLRPRTRARDAQIFFLQMWGYLVAHELPYDDPERLRQRLKVDYPIAVDRLIGFGEVPNLRLQRLFGRGPGHPGKGDLVLTWAHWIWFLEPYLALIWVMARDPDRFPKAARQMAAVFDLGAVIYALVPTAPPWWAAEQGKLDPELRRIMVEVGEQYWGEDMWPKLYEFFGGNPWAAMPSIHFATALMAALVLSDSDPRAAAAGGGYAAVLAFALVYLGEHYVIDLIVGGALTLGVRYGERLVEPAAQRLSGAIQRLERAAD